MTKRKIFENAINRVAEDISAVFALPMGAIAGAIDGAINTAVLPTFLRKELSQEVYRPGLSSPGLALYKIMAPHISRNYENNPVTDESSIEKEVERRNLPYPDPTTTELGRLGYSSEIFTNYMVEPLVRWALLASAVNDISDGRADNSGLLAIPIALSALFETGRYIYHQIKRPDDTQKEQQT